MDLEKLMKSKKAAPASSVFQVDKSVCTVIASLPFRIYEHKPGLFPVGMFTIPAVKTPGDINSIVIKEGFFFRYVGDGKHIEQYEKAESIANSIVNDFINAQLAINIEDADPDLHSKPALFKVFGEWTKEQCLEGFQEEIQLALKQQDGWFRRLVALADDDWNRYHQHKMISDLQRYAAKHLNYSSEWTSIVTSAAAQITKTCPACTMQIPTGALICPVCRTLINPAEFEKLGFKKVG